MGSINNIQMSVFIMMLMFYCNCGQALHLKDLEIFDVSLLRVNDVKLVNKLEVVETLGDIKKIDSLFMPGTNRFQVFWLFEIDNSYISLKVENDSSFVNQIEFVSSKLKVNYNDFELSSSFNLDDLKNMLPSTYEQYILNEEGMNYSFKDGKKELNMINATVRSNKSGGYITFEFSVDGHLEYITQVFD